MSIEKDILNEINELLGEAEPAYGPETLEARPIDRPPPAPRPPKVGTTIQRSDRENRIKAAMLATPPPPLASCRRRRHHPPPPSRPRTQARAKDPGPHGPRTATIDHGGIRAGTNRPRLTLRGARITAV
ncbi:hypothetical protein ACFW04_006614 [Cataglyphis niger]